MINQPLLDFIKQQLQVGLTKEKISNDLLRNGWTLQDIEEGFRVAVPTPTATPPVSPYSGASYPQNINSVKTPETQQQTFQPQVQQSPIQQVQPGTISTVHPFIKYGLIIGIVGIIFFIGTFVFSNIGKPSAVDVVYLAIYLIATILITIFCTMLVAKMLKCKDRTFVKAFSAAGVVGFLGVLSYLIIFLKLPDFIQYIIGFTFIFLVLFFLKKIYFISYLRAFSLWLLYGLFSSIIVGIIILAVGFSFLFSLFNALQNQNPVSDTNTTQQVSPTQDQTQQIEQNNGTQVLPSDLNNALPTSQQTPSQQTQSGSSYTNPTYGYSLKYPTGWTINNMGNDDTITFSPNDSFSPENLTVYVYTWGYNEAKSENSLKSDNIIYQKVKMNVAGIPSIKLTYADIKDAGTYYVDNSRTVTLYIPNKGKNSGELVVVGHCTTFGTSNGDKKCSTAIDDIMNNLVFPSISFKK